MIQPKDEDFKKLRYPVHELGPGVSVLESFPELKLFPEFTTQDLQPTLDRNMVLKYIMFCYDKGSPYVEFEKNLLKRKAMCAIKAGFVKDKSGEFGEEVKKLQRNENEITNRMVIRYVRLQNDLKYSLLVAGIENYYNGIGKMSQFDKDESPDATNKRSLLFGKNKQMLEDIEELSEDIFNGDKELAAAADRVNEEETEKIRSYPEFIARLRADGEFPAKPRKRRVV